jgi:hypothetical protein
VASLALGRNRGVKGFYELGKKQDSACPEQYPYVLLCLPIERLIAGVH